MCKHTELECFSSHTLNPMNVLGPPLLLTTRNVHSTKTSLCRWTPLMRREKHFPLYRSVSADCLVSPSNSQPSFSSSHDLLYSTHWLSRLPDERPLFVPAISRIIKHECFVDSFQKSYDSVWNSFSYISSEIVIFPVTGRGAIDYCNEWIQVDDCMKVTLWKSISIELQINGRPVWFC